MIIFHASLIQTYIISKLKLPKTNSYNLTSLLNRELEQRLVSCTRTLLSLSLTQVIELIQLSNVAYSLSTDTDSSYVLPNSASSYRSFEFPDTIFRT